MAVGIARLRELLDRFELDKVFIGELGWDNPPSGAEPVVVPEDQIAATQIADKRGVGVWRIDSIPPSPVRRRIDTAVSRFTRERLLVFVGDEEQLWLWPEQRASGAGFRLVAHRYHPGALNEAILQRLAEASFALDEEGHLTVMGVLERVRRSFSADEVTKKFYREFKKHHDDLLEQIQGIGDDTQNSWYGSVLLNRLMFIYFMQKKGFLDDDRNYLRSRLQLVRDHLGPDSFYGFFRQFLLPLFHDGLGSHVHDYSDPEIAKIIGDVPYVNGGIFSPHLLEETHEINVPDEAFEAIFEFFDRYRWHLDEHPSDDPNEINPDVLGYIFEQYVNQKEQGAYYTKEDVTGYMASSTVIPALIERLGNPEDLWVLPAIDPDRYIWESVAYGADEPLPDRVSAGLDYPSERHPWSNRVPPSHGLPGETWWEAIDRHRRYRELRDRLADGYISDPNEAVTANIDMRTLLEDHFLMLNTTQELEEAWEVLSDLTILDPTCGSGAFLFAALEMLADFYNALIERATELASPLDPPSFVLALKDHPNRDYFVMKNALLNNLYGVDIMYEAGEIARLRLFLKLASQLTKRSELEPLPDLDFNIRTGNLLVGIANVDDAQQRLSQDLVGLSRLDDIVAAASDVTDAYKDFLRSQRESRDPGLIAELKVILTDQLSSMRHDVDEFLFEARGEEGPVPDWQKSHLPFHWFIEFPGVFANGGFDVVIGNPPYIRRRDVDGYRWLGFETQDAPDIYSLCMERAVGLVRTGGRFAMVVPHSLCFSSDYSKLRSSLVNACGHIWLSSYALMPDSLFTGVRIRNTIAIASRDQAGQASIWSGWRNRWTSNARPHLFPSLYYCPITESLASEAWPFLGSVALGDWIERVQLNESNLGSGLRGREPETELRYKKVAGYYVSMWPAVNPGDPPSVDADGNPIPQTKVGSLWAESQETMNRMFAIGIGKWFFVWWAIFGDDFDVTKGVIESFPVDLRSIPDDLSEVIHKEVPRLIEALQRNITYKGYKYKGRAGAQIANYYIPGVREHTDRVDRAFADFLADDETWRAVNLCYARLSRLEGDA